MREVKKSFWDFIAISGSIILSFPLMIISESIQARYLGATKYGMVALMYSAISLLFLFSLNWLTVSILRFGKEEFLKEGHLRKTSTSYLIASFCLLFPTITAFYIFKEPIFKFLEVQHPYAFIIIVIGVIIQLLKIYVMETLKTIRLIKIQAFLIRLGLKVFIVSGIIFLTFGWIKLDVTSVITVLILSDLAVTIIGFFFIKRKLIYPFVFEKKHMKMIFYFSIPFFFSGWVNHLLNYVDIYTIKYYLNLEDVGIYQAAFKVSSTVRTLIGSVITTLAVPIVIALKTENHHDKIIRFLRRIVPQLVFGIFALTSFIILISDILLISIYGNEFSAAITPFKILSSSFVFTAITSLLSGLYLAYDMTKALTIFGILGGILNLLLDIIAVKFFGINGAAAATILTRVILSTVMLIIINRKFQVKRNLTLLFCFSIFPIAITNLLPIPYLLKIALTAALLSVTFLLAHKFHLFKKEDVEFIEGVNMPAKAKQAFRKVIFLLARR